MRPGIQRSTSKRLGPMILLVLGCLAGWCGDDADALAGYGPLYDRFELTLETGQRTEIAGPLFFNQEREDDFIWGIPPLFVYATNRTADAEEMDFLYPLWTFDRFGDQKRWQFFQIFNQSVGEYQDETIRNRITVFPFYFHQRSTNPEQNYTALLPLYGRLVNRLYYKEIDFVLWPLWVKTLREGTVAPTPETEFVAPFFRWREERRVDVTTYNLIAPLFHYREGPGLKGWQALPFFSWERKDITTRTNKWGEEELLPGHRRLTVLWPIFISQDRNLGTPNEEQVRAVLPFFSTLRSPYRDSSTYLWPIGLTLTDDRARHYKEVGAPWPLIVFAHGEGKTTRRVWPLFSHASNASLESAFILWPVWKYNAIHAETLDRRRGRILWFLFSNTVEQNKETDEFRRRVDFWPLFTHRKEMDGSTRLQVLAPLEPILPNIDSIERDYSPLWSLWRSEANPQTGATSQSLLWNLYRRESSPQSKKCSLLFGLFQYQSNAERTRVRLFYIPFGGGRPPKGPEDPGR